MRLIDADRLYEQYEAAMRELVESTNCENISLEALSLLCGANLIANAPTVEAVPVANGRWIHLDPREDATISGKCSCCGWEAHYYEDDVADMPYCPNCGAKMDLEEQNEID